MKNQVWVSCLVVAFIVAGCGIIDPTSTVNGSPTGTESVRSVENLVRTRESPTTQFPLPDVPRDTRTNEDINITLTPALTRSPQSTVRAITSPLPVTGDVQFELLTQQGGAYNGVFLSDDTAWLGQGPRLVGMNLADPTNPQKISQSGILPGTVRSLIVRGTVAYVMAGHNLVSLDISDPHNPKVSYQLELPAGDVMALRGDILYVGGISSLVYQETGYGERSHVTLLDISKSPRIIGAMIVPYLISSIAPVSDELLYVAAIGEKSGLHAIETADPSNLQELRLHGVAGGIYRLQAFGNTLLAAHYNSLVAYDISKPLNLKRLWQQDTGETGQSIGIVHEILPYEGRIYTSGFALAANIIPAQSVLLPPYPLSSPEALVSSSLAAKNDYLYNAKGDLLTFSIGSSGELELANEVAALKGGDLATQGDRLYVLPTPGASLLMYQLPELTEVFHYEAQPLGDSCCAELYGVVASGNHVYLVGNYQMHALSAADLSLLGILYAEGDPTYPYWRGGRDGDEPVIDGIAYVPGVMRDNNQEAILFIDWRNPASPQLLGQIPIDPGLRIADSAVRDDLLAVSLVNESDREGSLELYDLSAEELKPIASAPFTPDAEPFEVQIGAGYVIVGDRGWGSEGGYIRTYSIPDLSLLTEIHTPPIYETELWNDILLTTFRGSPWLLALDISDPAYLEVVGAFKLADDQAEIAMSGDTVVVGNQTMGLYVLRIKR